MKNNQKRSKRIPSHIDFYFTVFSLISEGYNTSQIATNLNISKQALNWYIRRLKANGFIEKIGYGVWKRSKSLDFKSLTIRSKSLIRSHAFIFSLNLPKISNWENRKEYMIRNKIPYYEIRNRNIQQLTFRGYKTQISSKKIVIYFPKWRSYFSDSAKTGYNYAIYDYMQLLIGLEQLFNCSFKTNKYYKFKVCRNHYAIINSELAKMYNRNKQKLLIYDQKGYLWLLVDNSEFKGIGLQEEELVSVKTGIPDTALIKRFYNELRDTGITPLDMFNKLSNEVLIPLAVQIKLHLVVMQKISDSIEVLNERLKEFKR